MTPTLDCESRLERLSRRLDGDLSEVEERETAAHLEGCSTCLGTYETLEAVSRGGRQIGRETRVPSALPARILERLRQEGLIGRSPRQRSSFLLLIAQPVWATAAVVVLAVGTVLYLTNHPKEFEMRLDREVSSKPPAASPVDAVAGAKEADAAPRSPARESEAGTKASSARPGSGALGADSPQKSNDDRRAPSGSAVPDLMASKGDEVSANGVRQRLPLSKSSVENQEEGRVVGRNFSSVPTADSDSEFRPKPSASIVGGPAEQKDQKLASGGAGLSEKNEGAVRAELSAVGSLATEPAAAPSPAEVRSPVVAEKKSAAPESAAQPRNAPAAVASSPPAAPRAKESRTDAADQSISEVVPARWEAVSGTTWDEPPHWTSEAEKTISRVRGRGMVLKVRFSEVGKIDSVDFISGDFERSRQVIQMLKSLDRAVVPAHRRGIRVAGVGKVEMMSAGL